MIIRSTVLTSITTIVSIMLGMRLSFISMKAFAAFLNLVVAATLVGRWEEESWLYAYRLELPNNNDLSEIDFQRMEFNSD